MGENHTVSRPAETDLPAGADREDDMSGSSQAMERNISLGDGSVDGLLAGFAAGLAMLGVLIIEGWLGDLTAAQVTASFAPPMTSGPPAGFLLHLATAGIYGLIFGALTRTLQRRRILGLGVVYGLILWLLARTILLPLADSPLLALPAAGFLLAHLAYGLVLGFILARR